jgi:hypothetical protein
MQESDVEEYIQDIIKTRISGDIDKLSEFK